MRVATGCLLPALVALSCSAAPVAPADAGLADDASSTGLEIVASRGGTLAGVVGDAVALEVVLRMADGTTAALPHGSKVTWTTPSTVTALDPASTAPSPLPAPGKEPTAFFIDNPGRPDRNADLTGVLFITSLGTGGGTTGNAHVALAATVTGAAAAGTVTGSLSVAKGPTGDAARGATLYIGTGANCARCHGATGHGETKLANGATDASPVYVIDGKNYAYPAPGLNNEPGNVGADPAWNAALFAMSARSDMDNEGLTLREPMPDWLVAKLPGGTALTTQDFVDLYAFLKTQRH